MNAFTQLGLSLTKRNPLRRPQQGTLWGAVRLCSGSSHSTTGNGPAGSTPSSSSSSVGERLQQLDRLVASAGPTAEEEGPPRGVMTTSGEEDERELIDSVLALQKKVRSELAVEIERDSSDGVSAIPPLAPSGWRVWHSPGTNYFQMHRRIHREGRKRDPHEPVENQWILKKGGQYQKDIKTPLPIRSDVDITVYAPFNVQDLSLSNFNVPIVEWSVFDVLVKKLKPQRKSPPDTKGAPVAESITPSQQHVWDTGSSLFLQLASANSELRIRHAHFISAEMTRKLEEQCGYGKGDPLYKEFTKRVLSSEMEAQAHDWQRRQVLPKQKSVPPKRSPTSTDPLLERFGVLGDYGRSFLYTGPYITELSDELKDALMSYIMNDLHITAEVMEYICQTQYFMEQEEYMGWLGRWDSFSTHLLQLSTSNN